MQSVSRKWKSNYLPLQQLQNPMRRLCARSEESFMSYEAALELYVCSGMSGSGHLSSYPLLLQLHYENSAALHWTSVCCNHLMNDYFRVKMTAVLCKMLTRISLHINLDLGDSMCSVLQQHIDNSSVHDAKGSRYCRQCGWKLQINAVCAHYISHGSRGHSLRYKLSFNICHLTNLVLLWCVIFTQVIPLFIFSRCSPLLWLNGISSCRWSLDVFSNQLMFVFDSLVARLILIISEPLGFTARLVNWPHSPLETPLRARISIGSPSDGQTSSCVRARRAARGAEVIPEFKSAEVLCAPEQCVIATQQPGSPDTESDISTQRRK